MKPIVSVIMSTFSRGDSGYLKQAIDSVLGQKYTDFEFIIIDDGSKDSTQQIITGYNDPRIRYIRHEVNCGIPAIRVNQGIRLSRGKYLAFQFDDDWWYPEHLQITVEELDKLPGDYGMVFGLTRSIDVRDGSAHIIGKNYSPQKMFNDNYIGNQSVLIRKIVILSIGGFDEDLEMRRICDWDLWRRVLMAGYKIQPIPVITSINYHSLPDSLKEQIELNRAKTDRRMVMERQAYLQGLILPINYETLTDPDVLKKGKLYKSATGPEVYFVVFGYKHLISSEKKFYGLGFKWEDVTTVSPEELRKYSDGVPLM